MKPDKMTYQKLILQKSKIVHLGDVFSNLQNSDTDEAIEKMKMVLNNAIFISSQVPFKNEENFHMWTKLNSLVNTTIITYEKHKSSKQNIDYIKEELLNLLKKTRECNGKRKFENEENIEEDTKHKKRSKKMDNPVSINEIKDEFNSLRDEIRNEFRDEIKNEIRNEIRDEFRDELKSLLDDFNLLPRRKYSFKT